MDSIRNQAALRGRAVGAPYPSHSNHGVVYYSFPMEVERLSGTADTLNVVVAEDVLTQCPVETGQEYQATGEIRSFNNRSGIGSRLVISFFARSLLPAEGGHMNHLELRGTLCKAPTLRRTPLGREICDMLLAVNRRYGRADYLPCIAWGGLARSCGTLTVGDEVSLTGRLQSRKYRKLADGLEEERTAYEISVMELSPESDT